MKKTLSVTIPIKKIITENFGSGIPYQQPQQNVVRTPSGPINPAVVGAGVGAAIPTIGLGMLAYKANAMGNQNADLQARLHSAVKANETLHGYVKGKVDDVAYKEDIARLPAEF